MRTASAYFHHVRTDISPLLPASVSRIVDVGCGAGITLAWLKGLYPQAYTVGLEGNASLSGELAINSDDFPIVDLNGDLPSIGAPDLLLLLDVLEHLPNPEKLLSRLTAELAPESLFQKLAENLSPPPERKEAQGSIASEAVRIANAMEAGD